MAEPFEHLLAQATQSYRALLERSWTLLVARTPPDDAAAITAACDLQRQLITTGTAWLALVAQVRALDPAAAAQREAPRGRPCRQPRQLLSPPYHPPRRQPRQCLP